MYLQMKKPIYLKMQSGICDTQLDTRISMNHWLAKVTFTSEKKKRKKKKWFGQYNFFQQNMWLLFLWHSLRLPVTLQFHHKLMLFYN